jgi:hypothetical protein
LFVAGLDVAKIGDAVMQDLHAKLEKLLREAEDCELISELATDRPKRVFFAKLAVQLKKMARDVEQAVAERSKAGDRNLPRPDEAVSP